ncbi:MAG: GGDEF domain-containing protein [Fibromonadales bacterium]|nr:GGDEF domain-containing protein [Fibromonadales bacterium]
MKAQEIKLNDRKRAYNAALLCLLIYIAYIGASFAVNSFLFNHVYDVYLIMLVICAAFFRVRSYLIFIAISQAINLLLTIFVLPDYASGDVWLHFSLMLSGSVILFVVMYFAANKSVEVDRAFASFGALMKITPSVLILVNEDNKIKYLSQSVRRVLNISEPESFVGRNFLELFNEDSVKELFAETVKKRSFSENYQKITINEQVKTFDVFADNMSDNAKDGMFFMLNDVSEIVRLKELAEQDSLMDSLVQVPNRRSFDRRILHEWNRALREKVNLSFLMMDIDFFKKYNDTYGHRQGDELLKVAGRVFKKSLKRSTDFVARIGGEEFAVLLYATNSYQANVIAEQIRRAIEDEVILTSGGEKTKFTISIGVVTLIPNVDMECGHIVDVADKALYNAKQNGRNRVWVADSV